MPTLRVSLDTCIDMSVDMGIDVYIDACIGVCIDMLIFVRLDDAEAGGALSTSASPTACLAAWVWTLVVRIRSVSAESFPTVTWRMPNAGSYIMHTHVYAHAHTCVHSHLCTTAVADLRRCRWLPMADAQSPWSTQERSASFFFRAWLKRLRFSVDG